MFLLFFFSIFSRQSVIEYIFQKPLSKILIIKLFNIGFIVVTLGLPFCSPVWYHRNSFLLLNSFPEKKSTNIVSSTKQNKLYSEFNWNYTLLDHPPNYKTALNMALSWLVNSSYRCRLVIIYCNARCFWNIRHRFWKVTLHRHEQIHLQIGISLLF